MGNRSAQERGFGMGMPQLAGLKPRSAAPSSPEDLRLVVLTDWLLFSLMLSALLPQIFLALGLKQLASVSILLIFGGSVMLSWKATSSFIAIARRAAGSYSDGN